MLKKVHEDTANLKKTSVRNCYLTAFLQIVFLHQELERMN